MKIRIFDFDDTLFATRNTVSVTDSKGQKRVLSSHDFALYKIRQGDILDFSSFEKVVGPKKIKPIFRVFDRIYKRDNDRLIVILTARAATEGIVNLLKGLGYRNATVVGVASPDPVAKANYVKNKIEEGYDDIQFFDDSSKNIEAINRLRRDYPSVKIKANFVRKYD